MTTVQGWVTVVREPLPEAGDAVGGEVGVIVIFQFTKKPVIAGRRDPQRHCGGRSAFFRKKILLAVNGIA